MCTMSCVLNGAVAACFYLSLYLSVYCVLMLVSPFPPGAQLHVRSLVFLDQQVRLTGFSGGTGTKKKRGADRRKIVGVIEGTKLSPAITLASFTH